MLKILKLVGITAFFTTAFFSCAIEQCTKDQDCPNEGSCVSNWCLDLRKNQSIPQTKPQITKASVEMHAFVGTYELRTLSPGGSTVTVIVQEDKTKENTYKLILRENRKDRLMCSLSNPSFYHLRAKCTGIGEGATTGEVILRKLAEPVGVQQALEGKHLCELTASHFVGIYELEVKDINKSEKVLVEIKPDFKVFLRADGKTGEIATITSANLCSLAITTEDGSYEVSGKQ